jgi:hypothetical protein
MDQVIKYRMDHVIELCTHRDGLFVMYGKDTSGEHGELTGISMCVWMVPGDFEIRSAQARSHRYADGVALGDPGRRSIPKMLGVKNPRAQIPAFADPPIEAMRRLAMSIGCPRKEREASGS